MLFCVFIIFASLPDKQNKLQHSFPSTYLPYRQTGYFSKIITDYLSQNDFLKEFYRHTPDLQGIRNAIAERKQFNTNRKVLAEQLQDQYAMVDTGEKVKANLAALLQENTFTVCTAHQPNIFTGHLYFIYKIIHTIRMADILNKEMPENKFVPVFYVGSEDADLEELGEVSINGEKYKWQTKQTGAVGRMLVDEELLKILKKIRGQITVDPFGKEVIELVQECYTKGKTIQEACFCLVNRLFGEYGLLVLLPDNAHLKKQMLPIFEDDIFSNTASGIVISSSERLGEQYKVQAHPREINLFYLSDGIRNRIIEQKGMYKVNDTSIRFTKEELQKELTEHPERFSPNVILRALYQETILPNLAFVGGGGELAYWLELKDMFDHYKVPYPVLILRNSFLLITEKTGSLVQKLSLSAADLFTSENDLVKNIIASNTSHKINLEKEKKEIQELYQQLKVAVKEVDGTLEKHVEALQAKQIKTLEKLEVKLLRAEKVRFQSQQQQLKKVRGNLFPNNSLQERVDNFMPYYAKWGKDFLQMVYDKSLTFEQQFCIVNEE